MAYVIYHKNSTAIPVTLRNKTYKTISAAQGVITRWSNEWFNEVYVANYPNVDRNEDPIFEYAIAEVDYYYESIERQVVRKNLMGGAEYTESVNTPSYMSPASESYWSM